MGDVDDESRLDRRGFMGALAAGATLGASVSTGCGASLSATRSSADPNEVRRFCRVIDDGLPAIERRSPIGDIDWGDPVRSAKARRFAERADPIARRAIRSLHVAGAYGDLSEAAKADESVQRRMAAFAPEMDHSVIELEALLSTMPEEKRRRVSDELRQGDLAMQIAETLDREARSLDVSLRSRTKLRAAARRVSFRLAHQPPSSFIDEHVATVNRVASSRGIDILAQTEVSAAVAEEMFWNAQRRTMGARKPDGDLDGGGADELAPPPPPAPPPSQRHWQSQAPAQQAEEEDGDSPGRGTMITGVWMLGIGAAVFGLGGAIVAGGAFEGVFIMTAGAIGVLIGLIVLIVGAIIAAAAD